MATNFRSTISLTSLYNLIDLSHNNLNDLSHISFQPQRSLSHLFPTSTALQGRGIFLFTDLRDVKVWKKASENRGKPKDDDDDDVENYVVQRYITNPYLVGGKKFDLRIYVLVTAYMPLTVWLYRSGFVHACVCVCVA